MAYTVSEFITQATGGGAVKVELATPNTTFLLQIGGRSIPVSNTPITTKVAAVDGGTGATTETTTAIAVLDLGSLFSAKEVLESASLRKAIADGVLLANAGTIALSEVPTTN